MHLSLQSLLFRAAQALGLHQAVSMFRFNYSGQGD